MKNVKLNKIVILALSCLLLIGAVMGISASAEETPAVQIKYKNIAYEGAIQVLYAVEAENIPDGGKVQMYFYDSEEDTEPLVKDEYTDEKLVIGDVTYHAFFSYGIAPKNMRAPILAKAVIVNADGTVAAESELSEYSVWQYAVNRFEKSPTPDQQKLYTATLNYGASVQEMLVESGKLTEEDIIANGGWANEYCGIKLDSLYQGRDVGFESEVTYYAPGAKITSKIADSAKKYGAADAALHEVLDENGEKLTSSYIATTPGLTTLTANYMPGYVNALDYEYEDVDAIHSTYGYNDTALKTLGYKIEKFGTSKNATSSSSIVKDENGNSYMYAQTNGAKGGISSYWTLTSAMKTQHTKSFDVAFFETDFRWDGYGDDVTSYQDAVYLRIFTGGATTTNDGKEYTASFVCIQDSGAGSDTFRLGLYGLGKNYYIDMPKGEWFNIRFTCIPISEYVFINEFYINGELVQTCTWDRSDREKYNATDSDYMGVGLFTRSAAATSSKLAYAVDNTISCSYTTYTPGNGGMFSDEESYGTKFGFESGNLSDMVGDGISYSKMENGVLDFALVTNSSGLAIKKQETTPTVGTTHIIEHDIIFCGATITDASGNHAVAWAGLAETGRDKANQYLNIKWYAENPDENGEARSIAIYTADKSIGGTLLLELQKDTWYNVRFVYVANNVENADGTVTYGGTVYVYLNNKLVTSFTTGGYTESGDPDREPNRQFAVYGFEFRAAKWSGVSNTHIQFDNVYLETVADE